MMSLFKVYGNPKYSMTRLVTGTLKTVFLLEANTQTT